LTFICGRSRREFLLLVSLLLTTVLSASGKYLVPHLPEAALQIVGLIASFGVITLLFAMMFKRLSQSSSECITLLAWPKGYNVESKRFQAVMQCECDSCQRVSMHF
jgi:hypothetical protein